MTKTKNLLFLYCIIVMIVGCATIDKFALNTYIDKKYSDIFPEKEVSLFNVQMRREEYEFDGKETVNEKTVIYKHSHRYETPGKGTYIPGIVNTRYYSKKITYYKVIDGFIKDWAYYLDSDAEQYKCYFIFFCSTQFNYNNRENYEKLLKTSSGGSISEWRNNGAN